MTMNSGLFQGVIKLKTLCVGGHFSRTPEQEKPNHFPWNVLSHADDFKFFVAEAFDKALDIVLQDQDIDLIFVDADYDPLSEITMFITQVREIRPKLPVVVFTNSADDKMRHLMREGASWHFTKHSRRVDALVEHIQRHVFSPAKWREIFTQYASDALRPRIEPGLSYADLEALNKNPEERYIIKRLFANSDVVQIFRMDEGFGGSRIYTVKPTHQLKRILKIEVADHLETVQEKQEQLIQPRLNQRVGQIQGRMVRGQHFAGACYILAGSKHDAITLTHFLQNQNRVRKELIDKMLVQLQECLEQLYAGSSDTELRYWAPLYSRVLPTYLTLEDAVLVEPSRDDADYIFSADDLATLSTVPGNQILQDINETVRNGDKPEVILRGFEVAELDTRRGVFYLHDDLIFRYPVSPLLKDKNHPILRFKVRLEESQWGMLTHPVFRRGKRVCVKGRVVDTQETILARGITEISGKAYDFESETFELASGRFISPVANVRYLLWEVGREDMIAPIPQVSPVVHGDLNTSNILIEASDDVPLWLIDFSDARPGHIYFDLAKLEVEFRTHVFYRLFKEMVEEKIWDSDTATKFALLVENVLLQTDEEKFEEFVAALRDYQPEWYDNLYTHFPLYFENLLYFLYSLRKMAQTYSPERFKYHYPVAVFFQSISVLKFTGLDHDPWFPWSKRLALCCALVSGKQAIKEVEQPRQVLQVLGTLRQRSSFALITVGTGEERKYLLQWNANWEMFNLVGGRINNDKGDRDSFARAIQRELWEELGLKSPKDYRILKELKPLRKRQFSRREFVFKDYEFRVFQIEFSPRHPVTREEYERFAKRLSPDRENILVSRTEIERLRTFSNRPISTTTRMILQELGEMKATAEEYDIFTMLDFQLDSNTVIVGRGRAQLKGRLTNPRFANLVENVTLEVLPSPVYEAERNSAVVQIGALDAGQEIPVSIWLKPKEKQGIVSIRATYYDVRGKEYRQLLENEVRFEAQDRSLFHIDNPYVVGKPLTPASESLFVGREDVFMWIEENLLGKTQPHTLILYGQRRMGKTSTLYQLVGGQRGQTIREYPGYPVYPVYIDLQRLAGCHAPEFFERLSLQILRGLSKRGIQITRPSSPPINGKSYAEFDYFLDHIEANMPHNGLLVMIIDELEQLQDSVERGQLGADIFPYLRSLIQHRSRLTFILAGTSRLTKDHWRIISHVGISREIVSLARDETEKLIREPVLPMIQYEDRAVAQIWRATQGHPYFTQLICHRLISATNLEGRKSKVIDVADVAHTIEIIIGEDDSHLQHLWDESAAEEQFVLAALAGTYEAHKERISRADISARLHNTLFTKDALNKALKKLAARRLLNRHPVERKIQRETRSEEDSLLVSKEYGYSISFDLLRRWVALKHPLGSLLQ